LGTPKDRDILMACTFLLKKTGLVPPRAVGKVKDLIEDGTWLR
jgi:hypothetical protein